MRLIFLLLCFCVSRCLQGQDSIRNVQGIAIGLVGGVNNSFMGFIDTYKGKIQSYGNSFEYRRTKHSEKWAPVFGVQAEAYSSYKKFKIKGGITFLQYNSLYTTEEYRRSGGLGAGSSYSRIIDISQQVYLEQVRAVFLIKRSLVNFGIGLSYNIELFKSVKAHETYSSSWYAYSPQSLQGYGTNNYSGPAREFQRPKNYQYLSYALLFEIPLKKLKSEITFRYDGGPKINQHFLLIGFNKKFKLKTIKN